MLPRNHIWSDMTGEYSLSTSDVEGTGLIGYPFVEIDMVRVGGMVTITQEAGNTITFSSRINNGRQANETFLISKQSNLAWGENCLVFHERKMILGGIFPGFGFQIRQSVLTEDANGNLQIKCEKREKGMILFLIPFSESSSASLVLRRARARYR